MYEDDHLQYGEGSSATKGDVWGVFEGRGYSNGQEKDCGRTRNAFWTDRIERIFNDPNYITNEEFHGLSRMSILADPSLCIVRALVSKICLLSSGKSLLRFMLTGMSQETWNTQLS